MRVELGDGIAGLTSLPEGSAALAFADLPSGETRAEFDQRLDLARLWPAVWHALAPNGIAVLLAASFRFAAELQASQLRHFRYDLVWEKSLGTGFLNARHRPLRSHEFLLVFWRGRGRYYPQMKAGYAGVHAASQRAHGENYGPMTRSTESRAGATTRYPTSVLHFGSVGTSSKERKHPQQKPLGLLQWVVRTFTQPGDLVVDPCAGSGVSGVVSLAEGRLWRGWDSSPRYGQEGTVGSVADWSADTREAGDS